MVMEAALNETYITLDGFIQMRGYEYVYFVIMLIVYILILCFNSTIALLIVFKRSLHEPMYIFIAALLVNSMLVSTVVYPKLLIDLLSERQIISYSACFFQNFMFYTLAASEFMLLAAMSYDRYVSICKPLQYPVIMRKRTVIILLVLAWLISAVHLSVFKLFAQNSDKELCSYNLKGIFCNASLYDIVCVPQRTMTIFTFLLLLNLAVFPVLFILFTYARILIITYRSSKEVRRKAANTCLPHLLVLVNYLCLCLSDGFIILVKNELSNTLAWIITLQKLLYQPLVNPIIYGLKMKEIFKHLKKLPCRVRRN